MTPRKHNPALLGIALLQLTKAALVSTIGFGTLGWIGSGFPGQAQELMNVLSLSSEKRALVNVMEMVSGLSEGKLRAIGIVAFCYAGLFLIEGIGLWFEKRWAEYLTAIVTASLLPIEIYELFHKFSLVRSIPLIINLAVLAFLIWIIRSNSPHKQVAPVAARTDPA